MYQVTREHDTDSSYPTAFLGGPAKDMKPELKRARAALQDEVSRIFRIVIGVTGNFYPHLTVERLNQTTGERYLNPVFDSATVKRLDNHHLFNEVAKHVQEQLKGASALIYSESVLANILQGQKYYPPGLAVPDVTVTGYHNVLVEMAKTSFRSCKAQWRAQTDAEVAAREQGYLRTNRMRDRRLTECIKQLNKAVGEYAAKYNLKPAAVRELLHEQYMSGEASGPEDRNETAVAVWNTRMEFNASQNPPDNVTPRKIEYMGMQRQPHKDSQSRVHFLVRVQSGFLKNEYRERLTCVQCHQAKYKTEKVPPRRVT
ncbi:hypothetical protein C8J57DRAFT_1501344 [Mycena rebaudengoi]|nr:hypothetical protein C8J57DRAFT_1501344 [Mycena rebaudengoi]